MDFPRYRTTLELTQFPEMRINICFSSPPCQPVVFYSGLHDDYRNSGRWNPGNWKLSPNPSVNSAFSPIKTLTVTQSKIRKLALHYLLTLLTGESVYKPKEWIEYSMLRSVLHILSPLACIWSPVTTPAFYILSPLTSASMTSRESPHTFSLPKLCESQHLPII